MISDDASGSEWSLARRVAFRFALVYWVVYNFPFPLDFIPGFGSLGGVIHETWSSIVSRVAAHAFQLSLDPAAGLTPNGSGDTTFHYVEWVSVLGLAALVTLVWSWLGRRARAYPKLHDGLRTYVRFVLATAMWSYGMSKVIQLQFPPPSPDRLLSTFGEASPMGLLWTFMGASIAYTAFAGACEVLGGLLLFFRRTTTLGALVVVGVTSNVVTLNFCYDVPVKLYSLHLLVMAAFLVLPDLSRLLDLLVFNRPTRPRVIAPPPGPRGWVLTRRIAWVIFVGFISIFNVIQSLEARHLYGDQAPKPAVYGVFEVEEFLRNGSLVPAHAADSLRWRRLSFNRYGGATLRRMGDQIDRYLVKMVPNTKTVKLVARDQIGKSYDLRYSRPAKNRLVLEGTVDGGVLKVSFKELSVDNSFLMTRGFHWINEYPLNR